MTMPLAVQEQLWIDQTAELFEQHDININFGSEAPSAGRSGITQQTSPSFMKK